MCDCSILCHALCLSYYLITSDYIEQEKFGSSPPQIRPKYPSSVLNNYFLSDQKIETNGLLAL